MTKPPEAAVISITVTERPRGDRPPLRERVPRNARAAVAIVVALAALAGVAAPIALLAQSNRAQASRPPVSAAERQAIGAAIGYPYPPRCLTITIPKDSPDYARVNVKRTDGCDRFHGYLNASLHRVDHAWRLVLDEGQLFVPNGLLAPNRGQVRSR